MKKPADILFNLTGKTLSALTGCMIFIFIFSCGNKATQNKVSYERFRDSVIAQNKLEVVDTSNIFDKEDPYKPSEDSFDSLLISMDSLYKNELSLMSRMDSFIHTLKHIDSISEKEQKNLVENSMIIDSFLKKRSAAEKSSCRENGCYIYIEIVKSKQILYLYLDSELKDSFVISTGIRRYPTPDMNLRPTGPLLKKYTSKKWPGGNYKGLGNMPYAIFVRGGYAIHGTTPGNFKKLGTVASHGCIRLHPDNARVLFELIKLAGLKNTWVRVR